jgi:hypothetical protein
MAGARGSLGESGHLGGTSGALTVAGNSGTLAGLRFTAVAGPAVHAGAKKSPDVETPGLWYLDLISVVFC